MFRLMVFVAVIAVLGSLPDVILGVVLLGILLVIYLDSEG